MTALTLKGTAKCLAYLELLTILGFICFFTVTEGLEAFLVYGLLFLIGFSPYLIAFTLLTAVAYKITKHYLIKKNISYYYAKISFLILSPFVLFLVLVAYLPI